MRRTLPQDTQKGRPLRLSFVKRRSSLVAEPDGHVREICFTVVRMLLADFFSMLLETPINQILHQ